MRILKVDFEVHSGETFRIGWYVGQAILVFDKYVLARDINSGYERMGFGFIVDLT